MQHIPAGDIELAVTTQGHQGHPLLLVHGFPLDHTIWQPQIDFFVDHCRVIAPDLRGFGRSGVTAGTVTMDLMADDLVALLDALNITDKVIFCGLSMGGYVGWQFWRKYRDRVLAMIMCDTRALADTAEGAAGRSKLAAATLNGGSSVASQAMLPKFFASSTPGEQPDLVERVRAMIERNSPVGIAAALEGMAIRADARELLPTIDVPALVVVGEQDSISTTTEMREIADAIPDAAWIAVPKAGHLAVAENPAVVNEAIAEFITL